MGYGPANRTAQWFQDDHPGTDMGPVEKVVWHTTEGNGWPAYDGGAKAPHYTVLPDYGSERMLWRQHFPDSVNSRAMRNEPGGVQTNLDGALQVEIVGTCDETRKWPPQMLRSWDLEDWQLDGLAQFTAWAYREHGVPLASPSLWLAYGPDPRRPGVSEASAGASPARMTGRTWDRFRGHCGHQHAPENVHGDPGRLPMSRIIARATFILTPTPTDGDDDMQLSDKVTLSPSDAKNLGQADAEMTVGELLARMGAASIVTNKLLVEVRDEVRALREALPPVPPVTP